MVQGQQRMRLPILQLYILQTPKTEFSITLSISHRLLHFCPVKSGILLFGVVAMLP